MTIGDPCTFAVESIISEAYLREGLRALGCFVIYVGGGRYGVYGPNATLLGCSFDEVAKRVRQRGLHVAPFAKAENPGMIADAFREAIYSENAKNEYFGIPRDRFCDLVYSSDILWAPDGDEAFDDGSYVLSVRRRRSRTPYRVQMRRRLASRSLNPPRSVDRRKRVLSNSRAVAALVRDEIG